MPPEDPTTLADALVVIAELRAENAALRQQLATLQAQLDEVLRRLSQNSSNSNKPPSSDGPAAPPRPLKKRGRKPGGQPGHKGHRRALIACPDFIRPAVPSACAACGEALHGLDPKPSRHQVTDLPPLRAEVTEYQRHRLRCRCGHVTEADWPRDMPRGAFGPRLTAFVGYLGGVCHLSHDQTQKLCADVLGIAMARGSVANYRGHVALSLRQAHEETRRAVQQAAQVHADETPLCPHGRGGWLWVGVCAQATSFVCALGRSHHEASELLGEDFRGLLTTDQHGAYNVVPGERRQLCWAHLARSFQELSEQPGFLGSVGEDLVVQTRKVFRLWHQLKAGHQLRPRWVQRMKKVRARVEALLAEGAAWDAPLAKRCQQLWEQRASLWTFVAHEDVEPTNNAAERALRPAVVWRKKSYGPRSERGRAFVQCVLSVVGTARKQGRDVWAYLQEAAVAMVRQVACPKLLAQGP